MKAVILAAGRGLRMMPLTADRPKPLIEVCGKPFLEYVIGSVRKAGFDDIGIVTNYKEEMILHFLMERGIDATILHQREARGTGDAIMTAREFTEDGPFLALMGDNLYSYEDMRKMNVDDARWYMAGMRHERPEKYGVMVLDEGGFVQRIEEKPKKPPSDVINIGLYRLLPDIYEKISATKLSERGELEITDAFNMGCAEGKVKAVITGVWKDMGCPADVPEVENFLKSRKSLFI